jgi:hypothetical protein
LVCFGSRGPPGGPRRPREGPRIAQGDLPGASPGPGARAKNVKTHIFCRALLTGREAAATLRRERAQNRSLNPHPATGQFLPSEPIVWLANVQVPLVSSSDILDSSKGSRSVCQAGVGRNGPGPNFGREKAQNRPKLKSRFEFPKFPKIFGPAGNRRFSGSGRPRGPGKPFTRCTQNGSLFLTKSECWKHRLFGL